MNTVEPTICSKHYLSSIQSSLQRPAAASMNGTSPSPDQSLVHVARGAAIGVIQSELSGRIQYANPRLLLMLGYTHGTVEGKTVQDITHPEDLHLTVGMLERLSKGCEEYVADTRFVRQDGSLLFATVSGSAVRDQAGDIASVAAFIVDRTVQQMTKKALQASEERLHRALHIGGLNAWEWHLDTDEVTLSSNGTEFWGRTVGNASDFRGVIHCDDRLMVQEAFKQALQSGAKEVEVTYRLNLAGNGERWVQSKGEVIRAPDGRPAKVMGMTVDITERKQATEATLLLADAGQLLGSSLDYQTTLTQLANVLIPRFADWYAVDLLSDEGELQRVSVFHRDPSKVELAIELNAKYPPRRDVPRGTYHVMATGAPDWVEHIPDELLVQAAYDPHHLALLRDLKLQSYICVPLRARGIVIGAMTLVYAESDRRYSESDLRLAADIASRAASAVDNARLFSKLQLADRRKDEFLAMLAHELRNPLAPITTAAALLKKRAHDELMGRMAEVISRQVSHMTELIDDLLDVSRVTRGLITLEQDVVDIKAVVAAAIEQAQPLIEHRGHTLARVLASEPMVVVGDRARLVQAVANLLTNAAKYTPPGGKIELSASVEGERVAIAVSDNGVGIEKSMLTQVFELFVQASRTPDRSQGGLGIGLALVRSMVRLHGGDVRAYSEGEGRGSTFTITLPKALPLPALAQGSAPATERMRAGGCSIAIVDDNGDAAEVLAEVLRLHGHEVKTLPTSAAALELAAQALPDLFILDIGLPDIDGLTLARRLKSMPGGETLTLLALTGYGQPEDRQRALEAGFREHMVKPPDIDRLVHFITSEVLGSSHPLPNRR